MTTPTVNLGMSNIQTEFGGSNPIALSEYYSVNANVATSGLQKMANFLGISAALHGTYSGTMTSVYTASFPAESYGFNNALGGIGSMSPTTDSQGKTIANWWDLYVASSPNACVLAISGFSSDPGQGYFTTAYSKSSASASYGYSAGKATWTWSGTVFGIGIGAFSISYT